MCIIILMPPNAEVPWEGIKNGASVNRDGHGWVVASEEHGLEMGKSMSATKAQDEFKAAVEKHGPRSVKLWHSRIGTHGTKNVDNCHPFYVPDKYDEGRDEDTVMAHNGIMPALWHPELKDTRSDTRVFIDRTASWYCNVRGVPSRRGAKLLGSIIGPYNKLVFVSVRGGGRPKIRIINSEAGTWEKGVWYSNSSYKRRTYSSTGYYGTTGKQCSEEKCHIWTYGNNDKCFNHRPHVECAEEKCKIEVYGTETHCWRHREANHPYANGNPYDNGWVWQAGVKQEDGTWTTGRWVRPDDDDETVVTEVTKSEVNDQEFTDEIDDEVQAMLDQIDEALEDALDVKITDVDPDRTCEACGKKGCVHMPTNLCLNCKWCLDCWDHMDRCSCFDYAAWMAMREIEAAELAQALEQERAEDAAWLEKRKAEDIVADRRTVGERARDEEVMMFFGIDMEQVEAARQAIRDEAATTVVTEPSGLGTESIPSSSEPTLNVSFEPPEKKKGRDGSVPSTDPKVSPTR